MRECTSASLFGNVVKEVLEELSFPEFVSLKNNFGFEFERGSPMRDCPRRLLASFKDFKVIIYMARLWPWLVVDL